jgi:hypothetical protein
MTLPVYEIVEEDFSSALSVHIEASGEVADSVGGRPTLTNP